MTIPNISAPLGNKGGQASRTTRRAGTRAMESAALGPPSDLPPLQISRHLADDVPVDEGVPEALRAHLNYGCASPILPDPRPRLRELPVGCRRLRRGCLVRR